MKRLLMTILLIFGVCIQTLSVTGCATIASGTNQSLTIVTEKDVFGASCKLTDKKGGTWYLPDSPGSVTVRKGDGPMTIICKKEGYKPCTLVVDESISGATFGNIIAGGGIGIFVDAVSGAAQHYPDKIVVWMEPEEWDSEEERVAWRKEKEEFLVAQESQKKSQQEDSSEHPQ